MSGFTLITNKQIKKEIDRRWFKYFVDFTMTKKSHPVIAKYISSWSLPVQFNRFNRSSIPRKPGIYLFFVKPPQQIFSEQSYILYVGYSMNLFNRYGDYLYTYKNSDEPNYFERRVMLNAYENVLFYAYLDLNNLTEVEIQEVEDHIIDSIVPPINRDFANAVIKQQVRLNR